MLQLSGGRRWVSKSKNATRSTGILGVGVDLDAHVVDNAPHVVAVSWSGTLIMVKNIDRIRCEDRDGHVSCTFK